MNPKTYYADLKKAKTALDAQFCNGDCLVASLELPGGGKAGTISEVPNGIAARLLTEGSHRLVNAEEASTYRSAQILQQATSTDPIAQFRQKLDLLTGGSK